MPDREGDGDDADPSAGTLHVWHVTAHPLAEEPWRRFTVEVVSDGGRVRINTVHANEVMASLQVWLRRTEGPDRP